MAFVKLGSVKATNTVLVTSVNLAADVGATILPVANGGTGSGSFTNGQLLIGNTTGNTLTKATLTNVANQTVITNGGGSITIGTAQDIATGSSPTFAALTLTAALPLTSGGTGKTTAYAALDALTVQGANIASAGATNLATATGTYVNITGTTTITAFGTANAGVERICQFSGALTLTHNATSLILPGAANITTAAGDVATFVSLGSGNWICTGYSRTVQPWNGQLVLLASGSASGAATLDLTWASGQTYQEILIVMSNVAPATTTVTLQARTSPDGSSWDSGANNYTWTNMDYATGSFSGTDTKMIIAGSTTNLVTTANNSVSGEFKVFDPGATAFGKCTWHLDAISGGQSRAQTGGGNRANAAAIRGVRFFMSSGNLTGEFRLYGITRS